jgi:hypothetical protein
MVDYQNKELVDRLRKLRLLLTEALKKKKIPVMDMEKDA